MISSKACTLAWLWRLLAVQQTGGTARRHTEFGNGQRSSRASVDSWKDLRHPSLASKAAAALNARGNALPECTLGKATVLYERDEHGRVYMLVGASSNVRDPAHNSCRTPRDSGLNEDLRRHRILEFGVASKSLEDIRQKPELSEEPPGSPEAPSKPSNTAKSRPLASSARTYCDFRI